MFGTYFYHSRIRKTVAAFGSLFTRVHVLRKDAAGKAMSTVRVPISYGPRSKFLARIQQVETLPGGGVAIKLPRMSFEMTSLVYDDTIQLPKMNTQLLASTTNDTKKRAKLSTKIPYVVTFSLNIYANNQDDALQIVEQILPYFAPSYSLTMKPYGDYDEVLEDIPVTLQSVSFLNDYEGDQVSRQVVQYVLDFEMKIAFTGPISDGTVINKSIVEFELNKDSDAFSIAYTPDPEGIFADSDYGFSEAYTYFGDSDGI